MSKRNGGGRRRFSVPSLAGIGLTCVCLERFGVFAAANQILVNKNFGAAGNEIVKRATKIDTYIYPILGGMALKMAREMTGPIQLCKVGRFSVRVI